MVVLRPDGQRTSSRASVGVNELVDAFAGAGAITDRHARRRDRDAGTETDVDRGFRRSPRRPGERHAARRRRRRGLYGGGGTTTSTATAATTTCRRRSRSRPVILRRHRARWRRRRRRRRRDRPLRPSSTVDCGPGDDRVERSGGRPGLTAARRPRSRSSHEPDRPTFDPVPPDWATANADRADSRGPDGAPTYDIPCPGGQEHAAVHRRPCSSSFARRPPAVPRPERPRIDAVHDPGGRRGQNVIVALNPAGSRRCRFRERSSRSTWRATIPAPASPPGTPSRPRARSTTAGRRRSRTFLDVELLEPLREPVHPELAGGGGGARRVERPVGRALDVEPAQRRDLPEVAQLVGLVVRRRRTRDVLAARSRSRPRVSRACAGSTPPSSRRCPSRRAGRRTGRRAAR